MGAMERNRGGRPRHPDVLTPAEWRVLEALREGGTNAEIGARLGISADAVKYHISNMLGKAGAARPPRARRLAPRGASRPPPHVRRKTPRALHPQLRRLRGAERHALHPLAGDGGVEEARAGVVGLGASGVAVGTSSRSATEQRRVRWWIGRVIRGPAPSPALRERAGGEGLAGSSKPPPRSAESGEARPPHPSPLPQRERGSDGRWGACAASRGTWRCVRVGVGRRWGRLASGTPRARRRGPPP